jgi:hypothetical protein
VEEQKSAIARMSVLQRFWCSVGVAVLLLNSKQHRSELLHWSALCDCGDPDLVLAGDQAQTQAYWRWCRRKKKCPSEDDVEEQKSAIALAKMSILQQWECRTGVVGCLSTWK